jgi:hypothetical protein
MSGCMASVARACKDVSMCALEPTDRSQSSLEKQH